MKENAHKDIDTIFLDILPKHGMKPRAAQIKLCHEMFDTMTGANIALCDAGVGIGKTFSYLVAGVVHRKHDPNEIAPIVISTASIALQNAIVTEYIPFLSEILVEEKMIDKGFQAVVRKGKAHYVCDLRLEQRLLKSNLEEKNQRQKTALLNAKYHLDLDDIHNLSSFDKKQICVPDKCNCKKKSCRYKSFVRQSKSPEYLFQICNHNFFIADAMHRRDELSPLLPDYCAIVIDEAHKLPDAARQMFGKSLEVSDMKALLADLKSDGITVKGDKVHKWLKMLYADMLSLEFDESGTAEYPIIGERMTLFINIVKLLNALNKALVGKASDHTINAVTQMIETLTLFKSHKREFFYYAEKDESGKPTLKATLIDMDDTIKNTLWKRPEPIILTSGTLSVGKNFKAFRDESAIKRLRRTVTESVANSPFDYENNCMLYLPKSLSKTSDVRIDDIAYEIERILTVSQGHGLVLFTSYSEMSRVCSMLMHLPFPMFIMGKNRYRTIADFKCSKNGVLFATGAAWEGVDFPGDIVSSLIIVRLPFPIPSLLTERKKSKYTSLQLFIDNAIVPSMQMKLKQGAGRAIRTETDTCVISILDKRSLVGGKYRNAVIEALPKMPITDDIRKMAEFIRRVKGREYFKS